MERGLSLFSGEMARRATPEDMAELDFKEVCARNASLLADTFTKRECALFSYVPMVILEMAWRFALEADRLATEERIGTLKPVHRTLGEYRRFYLRYRRENLNADSRQRLERDVEAFIHEKSYNFTVLRMQISNEIANANKGGWKYEEISENAATSMLLIAMLEAWNRKMDRLIWSRGVSRWRPSRRTEMMARLWEWMELYLGNIDFNSSHFDIMGAVKVIENKLYESEFDILPE